MKHGCLPLDNNNINPSSMSLAEPRPEAIHYLEISTQQFAEELVVVPGRPSWEQPWIQPELRYELFEHGVDGLRTYCLLDAARVTELDKVFDTDSLDELGMKCLLSGDAAKEIKNYAPYLVDISLSEEAIKNGDISSFHRQLFTQYWGKHCAIFIKSTADLSTLTLHLKKFIKLRNDDDKWFYFRFYDPRIGKDYFSWMQQDAQRVAKWFGINKGQSLIESIILETDSGKSFTALKPINTEQLTALGKVSLSSEELNSMQFFRWQTTKQEIFKAISEDVRQAPFLIESLEQKEVDDLCESALAEGFETQRAIYDYVFTQALAQHFNLDLSEVNQYLQAKDSADLEKSKELYQILLNAINTYRTSQQEV